MDRFPKGVKGLLELVAERQVLIGNSSRQLAERFEITEADVDRAMEEIPGVYKNISTRLWSFTPGNEWQTPWKERIKRDESNSAGSKSDLSAEPPT